MQVTITIVLGADELPGLSVKEIMDLVLDDSHNLLDGASWDIRREDDQCQK
jgi:hypothetical protein